MWESQQGSFCTDIPMGLKSVCIYQQRIFLQIAISTKLIPTVISTTAIYETDWFLLALICMVL